MTQLDATSVLARARVHLAVLRGLYGDIAENLDDPGACNELWVQIDDEQARLAELVQRGDVPV
jgi:hypothetical protein